MKNYMTFESPRSEVMTELKEMVSNKFKDTITVTKFFQVLSDAGLESVEDWKKVTKEDKKRFPVGLKYLLDEKAGIEHENVRMRHLKMKGGKGVGRNEKQDGRCL
jgi:hypothetical protein